MKKIIVIGILFFSVAGSASAATVPVSPSAVAISSGQVFSVNVFVNGAGEAVYTSRVVVSFPANLLEVRSFTFASEWLPLSQPGYDSIDNTSGKVIKTAGFSGGVSGSALFGTMTFRAKEGGTAEISVSGGTQLLNANNQNVFTGGGSVAVNIRASEQAAPVSSPSVTAPKQTQPVRPKNNNPKKELFETSATTALEASTTSAGSTTSADEDNVSNTASASRSLAFPTSGSPLGVFFISSISLAFALGILLERKQISL